MLYGNEPENIKEINRHNYLKLKISKAVDSLFNIDPFYEPKRGDPRILRSEVNSTIAAKIQEPPSSWLYALIRDVLNEKGAILKETHGYWKFSNITYKTLTVADNSSFAAAETNGDK